MQGISAEEYCFRPNTDHWSVLVEVLRHQVDEEVEDFRLRVRIILENPDTPLPQFDQVGWVTTRAYQQQDPESKLQEFVKEREASILWLKSLERPNWFNTQHHPKMGAVTAE